MKKRFIVALSVVLSALIFAMPVMANAASTAGATKPQLTQQEQQQVQQIQEKGKIFDQLVATLQPYLHRNADGTMYLQVPPSVLATLNVQYYEGIQKGLALTNQLIKEGTLSSDSNFNIIVKSTGTNVMPMTVSGGVSKIVYYWWGYYVYLSHSLVKNIEAGSSIAAGIALFIPDPTLSKIVAALLATEVGVLMYFDNGNGVYFRLTYMPNLVITGIWSQ